MTTASFADTFVPMDASSKAFAIPTSLGRNHEDPESGTRPILMNTSIRLASSEATMRSHASAIEHPAPAATPLSLQITGFGRLRIARIMGLYLLERESMNDLFVSPPDDLRSCPEQKAFPSPVKTTTRTVSSLATAF